MKILKCKTCGNILIYLEDSGVTPMCCGKNMEELQADSVDAAYEKHVPYLTKYGTSVTVQVGKEPHPMQLNHYIKWIILETSHGKYIKYLNPNDKPVVEFTVEDKETILNVYEYCSIHGLWKTF